MKLIPLTQGQFAQVDDEDYDSLMQWKWHAIKGRLSYYAVRAIPNTFKKKRQTTLWMHREIMNTEDGVLVDHVDHDGLNNQKGNLRNCSISQNNCNKKPVSKTGFKGVTKVHERRYRAAIRVNRKALNLGAYEDPVSAAKMYDMYAEFYFGEFAFLNFPKLRVYQVQ